SFVSAAAPVVGAAAAAGVAANVLQVRLRFSPVALQPSLAKLNPLPGLKRIGSKDSAIEAAKAMAKTAAVGVAAFVALWPNLPKMALLVGLPPDAMLGVVGSQVLGIAMRVLVVFVLVAAADWFWQRHRLEKQLMMSQEEGTQQ